jgi:hypothetical protein
MESDWFCEYVGDVKDLVSDITTTRYGIAFTLEKVLNFTESVVDFHFSFKCCA